MKQDSRLTIKYSVERFGGVSGGKPGPESTIKSDLVKQRHLRGGN